MAFLFPQFLWALFAVSIPVIIHLFNFRTHKVVYFSNIAFLKNIEKQTKSKQKLKEILILITRILIVICLVLAFSQPIIPLANKAENNIKDNMPAIYFDNSFSMNSESKYGKIIEVAKNKAYEIINSYPNTTDFLFINNSYETKHQHFYNKEIIQDFINETEPVANVRNMSSIYSKMLELLKINSKNKNHTLYYISDFQKISTDFENLANDSNLQTFLLPLSTQKTNNIYIDSIWFETPYRSFLREEIMFVKITNKSLDSYQDMPVQLFINDTLKTIASYNIEPESSKIVELRYTNTHKGLYNGRIVIIDYPIVYDNEFYFSYSIAKEIKILIINEQENNKYLNSFFESDDNFAITNCFEKNVPVSQFNNYHLLILSSVQTMSSGLIQELQNYIAQGGTVIFAPNYKGDIDSYNLFLSSINANKIIKTDTSTTFIKDINQKHIIYKDAFKEINTNSDLPKINKYFLFENNTFTNEEFLLKTETGKRVLMSKNYKKGLIYIFSFPLDEKSGNFMLHSLFSPTIYNISIFSQLSDNLYYTIGRDEIIEINDINISNSEFIKMEEFMGTYNFIPYIIKTGELRAIKLDLRKNKLKAGNYTIINDTKKIKSISFNYHRKESDIEYYTVSELKEKIKKHKLKNIKIIDTETKLLEKKLKQINEGKKLWKIFIILSLFFLAIEIFLIRIIIRKRKRFSEFIK